MRAHLTIIATALLSASVAHAEEARVFQCSAPMGKSVWAGNDCQAGICAQVADDGPVWSEDGFPGTAPIISIGRREMVVYWGSNAAKDRAKAVPGADAARKYVIPVNQIDDVSALGSVSAGQGFYVYRYFFKTNILQRVSTWHPVGRDDPPAIADIVLAECAPLPQ